MDSVIKELYLDNCSFSEKIVPHEDYKKMHKEYIEIFEKLLKGATKEQTKLLNELFDAGGGLEAELNETHFIEGFKLGLRLAAEAFK